MKVNVIISLNERKKNDNLRVLGTKNDLHRTVLVVCELLLIILFFFIILAPFISLSFASCSCHFCSISPTHSLLIWFVQSLRSCYYDHQQYCYYQHYYYYTVGLENLLYLLLLLSRLLLSSLLCSVVVLGIMIIVVKITDEYHLQQRQQELQWQ